MDNGYWWIKSYSIVCERTLFQNARLVPRQQIYCSTQFCWINRKNHDIRATNETNNWSHDNRRQSLLYRWQWTIVMAILIHGICKIIVLMKVIMVFFALRTQSDYVHVLSCISFRVWVTQLYPILCGLSVFVIQSREIRKFHRDDIVRKNCF